MAAELCLCGGTGNTGQSNCQSIFDRLFGIIAVEYLDASGAVNTVDPSVTIDQAFVDAKINNVDILKRWFPIMNISTVEQLRAEDLTETIDNVDVNAEQGAKSVMFDLLKHGPEYIGQMNQWKCKKFSYFGVDLAGNLIGMVQPDGLLAPIRADERTLSNILVDTTSAPIIQRVRTKFFFDPKERDENLRFIKQEDITADLLKIQGLFDILASIVAGSISTTDFKLELSSIFGGLPKRNPLKGFLEPDFDLNEITPTPGVIVITSVTENPDGTYQVVFPLATTGDVLRLTLKTTVKGFDDAESLQKLDILIP